MHRNHATRFSRSHDRMPVVAVVMAVCTLSIFNVPANAQPTRGKPASVLVRPPAPVIPSPAPPSSRPASQPERPVSSVSTVSPEQMQQLITQLARQHIPHDFEDTKKWGMQSERWDGIIWERDGLKIESRRRKKMVNHGDWKRYKAYLIDPDQQMTLRISDIHRQADDRIAFHVDFVARIGIGGRVSKWVKGMQLYSFSGDAKATVELRVDCLLDTQLDFTKLPPDLVFAPEVTNAELKLIDFELDRISKAGGELADQLGKTAEKKLQEKLDEKADKLVAKANKSIEKKKDKLRLSAADFFASRFGGMADKLLPEQTVEQLRGSATNAAR